MGRTPPNFLVIEADQLPPQALPMYGNSVVKAPHMQALADAGVLFDNAYCNFALCAPSRFSMLSGRLASRIGAYDNGAEFAASVPTFAHHLRLMGYQTCLSGKMHFIGPDQLHGFEERLTTDIYPSDFLWTADWSRRERLSTSEMGVVLKAGPCERSVQVDFDDEVTFHAVRKIYDIARDPTARPFFLVVSFTHPHDPFTTPWEYWNRYHHDTIDGPTVPPIPMEERDPHSQRISDHFGIDAAGITAEQVRVARHAFYGSISYVDDRIGELLSALKSSELGDDTIVIFTSDHGEFLGERGLWFKRSFYEWSQRIPLIVHAPGRFSPRRVSKNVSLLDLFPTLLDLAGRGDMPEPALPHEGHSLSGLLHGREDGWPDMVLAEILCECTEAPLFMVKRGHHKYVCCETDPAQLFDLAADPNELENLAGRPESAAIEAELAAEVECHWDTEKIKREVVECQQRRLIVNKALAIGHTTSWDYRPILDASRQYYRGKGASDAKELIERGISYGIIESTADGIRYDGRIIGKTSDATVQFLESQPEIANAIERQITEAAGHL